MKSSRKLTQVEALQAQIAAIAHFKETGDQAAADEAGVWSKITRVVIGINGTVVALLDSAYLSAITTENTGGGTMVDFVFMDDGRVITLNDECICVYASKEDFYEHDENKVLHTMWISDSMPGRDSSSDTPKD